DIDAARELVETVGPELGELFVYSGDQHLFSDRSLPSYDADASALVVKRSLGFLDRLGRSAPEVLAQQEQPGPRETPDLDMLGPARGALRGVGPLDPSRHTALGAVDPVGCRLEQARLADRARPGRGRGVAGLGFACHRVLSPRPRGAVNGTRDRC